MATVKIQLPPVFSFDTMIPIRITDLNYGGHVGNDSVLSIIHEARIQFLRQFGYDEMNVGTASLIMLNVVIDFRKELFYGDVIKVSVKALEFSKIGFDLCYKLEKVTEGKSVVVAAATTGMICYDYGNKKISSVPEEVKLNLLR
ncbi:MAG: thioesterase family protein [Chitinophagaceae bacterium]